jgi:predicted AlkP superfamily pyrophosphatase or phosphodiesterase
MNGKVVLILVDGMRPDAVALCTHHAVRDFMGNSLYTLSARTVMPSVTLPTHMSLFHSVPPERHGIITNTYTPMVRPLDGLCERIHAAGGHCAFFYNWEQLRDLSRPGILLQSAFFSGGKLGHEPANELVTAAAIESLNSHAPDFMFVYLGWVDGQGHDTGWMSEEYMRAVSVSWDEIARISDAALKLGYTVFVTADHGGHERSHGSDMDEDMTIPLFIRGANVGAGQLPGNVSIMDIAPTAAAIVGAQPAREWEGRSLV